MSDFEIKLQFFDQYGERTFPVSDKALIEYDYALVLNTPHVLTFSMRECSEAKSIGKKHRVKVYYSSKSCGFNNHEGETQFEILKKKAVRTNEGLFYYFTGYSLDNLLNNRGVPWPTNSPYAQKEEPAESMMKLVFKENFLGDQSQIPLRTYLPDLPDYVKEFRNYQGGVDIALDKRRGFILKRKFGWEKSLQGFFEGIAEEQDERGEPMYWNIVSRDWSNGEIRVPEFETYFFVRGTDRTGTTLSYKNGSILESETEWDYTTAKTVVWSAGRGEEDNRQIAAYVNVEEIDKYGYGWNETIHDARNSSDEELLAEAALRTNSEAGTLTITATMNPEFYNNTYKWGDRVRFSVDDVDGGTLSGVAIVSAVNVSKRSGRYQILAKIKHNEGVHEFINKPLAHKGGDLFFEPRRAEE